MKAPRLEEIREEPAVPAAAAAAPAPRPREALGVGAGPVTATGGNCVAISGRTRRGRGVVAYSRLTGACDIAMVYGISNCDNE